VEENWDSGDGGEEAVEAGEAQAGEAQADGAEERVE